MEDFKKLALNIRKYRKMHRLTQAQLAERLCVTAQNVSKWEKGLSLPDLGNLCRLSQVLSVSVDDLLELSNEKTKQKKMIAVDGGGTKTEFVLLEENGTVLKRIVLSGTNPNSCGLQTTLSVLSDGIEKLLLESPDVSVIYGGIAGCSLEEYREKVLTVLRKKYPTIKLDIRSDILNVINCFPYCDRFIAAICGTGSVVYAKTPTNLHRIGGWGYAFDSGGSGYDFGRDAISAALAEDDGIGEKTCITKLVEEKIGGKVFDNINKLYASGRDYIASFSTIVFDVYLNGDPVAKQILEKNVDRLAFLIENAARLYDCGFTAEISGGLVEHNKMLIVLLQEKLKGKIKVEFNELPQIYGASVGCHRMLFAKKNFDKQFQENFLTSYHMALGGISHVEN